MDKYDDDCTERECWGNYGNSGLRPDCDNSIIPESYRSNEGGSRSNDDEEEEEEESTNDDENTCTEDKCDYSCRDDKSLSLDLEFCDDTECNEFIDLNDYNSMGNFNRQDGDCLDSDYVNRLGCGLQVSGEERRKEKRAFSITPPRRGGSNKLC